MNHMRKNQKAQQRPESSARIVGSIGAAALIVLAGSAEEPVPTLAHEMLTAHNAVRQKIAVRPLKWSDKLAAQAEDWAKTLASTGASKMQGIPGQNIAYTTPPGWAKGADIVAAWAAEVTNYDHEKNACIDAKLRCRHYTQVVWRNTNLLGCAVAHDAQRDIWVCDYDPPGNDAAESPY
jgi:pathogenesis-related protein 1